MYDHRAHVIGPEQPCRMISRAVRDSSEVLSIDPCAARAPFRRSEILPHLRFDDRRALRHWPSSSSVTVSRPS
jgi:hypothetical protein